MLHIAQARHLIESGDPVDISFWKQNGEIVNARDVVCLSSNFENNSFNIKYMVSGEIRKIKALLVHNVNGEEVYL